MKMDEVKIKFILPLITIFLASFFLWFDKITGDSWIILASAVIGAPLGVDGWKNYQLRKLQESAMSHKVEVPVALDKNVNV